ncbi:hydroxymethylglutaryl-CoA lyase [Polynucleobacter sp. AM-26B4]|uniref:hydroxymethylglutaryl-CoA lyase n=1 Tax=Polynucleobacter sp. AM-26B4 TaxID=2689103 RepID=UPI001C0DEAC7|nr:hydroxymethylglutaryl-CoA lyase [Polynucleobacter sp. AM-26B4]MBU3585295.1 hydroxymethylglutaryl-CoA lyase [Polynucleobacter sp. AM-26B4]
MSILDASDTVLISEVGPRDGLQSIKSIMPTEGKRLWLNALYEAGLKEIEVCSFVPPSLLPQMADAPEIASYAKSLRKGMVLALAPNLKGAQLAIQSGVDKVTIPVSASQAHLLANVKKTRQEMISEVKKIIEYKNQTSPNVLIEVGISTAFGCTLQESVSELDVISLAFELADMGVDEVGLSDTAGYANPAQVKRLFKQLRQEIGEKAGAAHMHNTRGLGLANCLAAFEEGVRTFDSSQGGLGGCPYAPGASGNVVTEDLVFMFEAMGVKTGINFEQLLKAREILQAALPNEAIYGMTPQAGLPKGFSLK